MPGSWLGTVSLWEKGWDQGWRSVGHGSALPMATQGKEG